MAGMSVKLNLDASGYTKGIQEASDSTKQYTNQVTTITKELPNMKRELAQAKKETLALTLAISRMTDQQKASAEGRAMIKMLEDTKQKAAELTDMMGDTNAAIKTMASDTRELDVFGEVFGAAGNAVSAFSGVLGLATGQEDKLKKAVVAFTTVQSVSNTVTKLAAVFQKQSATMQALSAIKTKIKTAATNADTAATVANTGATTAGTAAQHSLNTAIAIGKALLGDWKSIVMAVAVAIGGYAAASALMTDELEDATNAAEEAKKRQQEYKKELIDTYSNAATPLYSSYLKLQAAWKSLHTEAEKKQFIKDYANEMKQLGVAVNSVVDAENLFVKNTEAFRRAILLRATLAVLQKQLEEQVAADMKARAENETKGSNGLNNGEYSIHNLGARGIADDMVKVQSQIDNIMKQFGGASVGVDVKPSYKKGNSNEPTKEEIQKRTNEITQYYKDNPIKISIDFSQAEIEDKIKKLKDKLKNTPLTIDGKFKNPEVSKIEKEIESWEKKLKPSTSIVDPDEFDKSMKGVEEHNNQVLQKMMEDDERAKQQKIDNLNEIGEGIQTISGMMASVSQLTDDEAINIMAIVGQAVANVALGFSKALAKEGKLGVWDWIAAAAAGLATMVSVQQAIKQQTAGYAEGGVITGPNSIGDRMIARVNSGEMILNNRQQSNLFNAIDENRLGNNQPQSFMLQSVKVRGADLYLTMKNYENTTGKKL